MDKLLIDIKDLKETAEFEGKLADFKSSSKLVDVCRKNGVIAKGLMPSAIEKDMRSIYFDHLACLAKEYLENHSEIRNWDDFCKVTKNRAVAKIFFEFGVKAEVFDNIPEISDKKVAAENPLRITEEEVFELSKIRFNFKGSLTSFKRMIVDLYGSYAEYCIEKGFDINQTKWEDREVALRCAIKIGNMDKIKRRSKSLYKYLTENHLADKVKKVS